jgi:hypothetical protein
MKHEAVYPFWRIHAVPVEARMPLYMKAAFQLKETYSEVYSIAALQDFLRAFLEHPDETEKRSPIELEVLRITHEPLFVSAEGREKTERAVYHIDFRQSRRDLIGHNSIQTEIQCAWESVGGRFTRLITEYDREGRPIRLIFREPPKRKQK